MLLPNLGVDLGVDLGVGFLNYGSREAFMNGGSLLNHENQIYGVT